MPSGEEDCQDASTRVSTFTGTGQGIVAGRSERARPRVLVAIPCFNEARTIGSIVTAAKGSADEVLVVDDGSTDGTAEVAQAAGASVFRSDRNRGKGAGVRRAFAYAYAHDFDALLLIDGDGQHNPEEIPKLLSPVLAENGSRADVALGFRHGENTEMPSWRRVGKRALDVATALGGAGVMTDSQCGFRAFGRRAIEEMHHRLKGEGYSVESEQLVVAQDSRLKLQPVSITCKYTGVRANRPNPVGHAASVLASLLGMIVRRRPLLTLGLPGVLALVSAIALAASAPLGAAWPGSGSTGAGILAIGLAVAGLVALCSAQALALAGRIEQDLVERQRIGDSVGLGVKPAPEASSAAQGARVSNGRSVPPS